MTTIYVYADWQDIGEPTLVGTLRATLLRGKEHFSFAYDEAWLQSGFAQQIDPELKLYAGEQHVASSDNFRVFLDSCPDRWGRLLMQRREAIRAFEASRRPRTLLESDLLLGVYDRHRMGALRFKRELDGPFLDEDEGMAAPPFARLRELQFAAQYMEKQGDPEDPEYRKWLGLLISPGSSLGGARPKASVVDEADRLWIAKFPSRQDNYDVGAWEYVVAKLALASGIDMADYRLDQFDGPHHTFLAQRFDRIGEQRLHFCSAMTQLGYNDGDDAASYLELAEFLTHSGCNTANDLEQLWRRVVFNIAVSNTDDHLRNHGFIFEKKGWTLSPAFDMNPVPRGNGLHLFITDNDNRLDLDLAMSVIEFYRIPKARAREILQEVLDAVAGWRLEASAIGLSRAEQQAMKPAFLV